MSAGTRRPKGYDKDNPTWADDYYVCQRCGARVTHGWTDTHTKWHQEHVMDPQPAAAPSGATQLSKGERMLVEAMRHTHRERPFGTAVGYCDECDGTDWPCDTADLLAIIDRLVPYRPEDTKGAGYE